MVELEGSLFLPALRFTLLDYMIIWCKIQVIMNPFIYLIIVEFLKCINKDCFFKELIKSKYVIYFKLIQGVFFNPYKFKINKEKC